MSSIYQPIPLQPRGVIIYELDENTEPKTILELGEISRPIPTYPSIHRPIASSAVSNVPSHPNSVWCNEISDNIPPYHCSYPEHREQRITYSHKSIWNSDDKILGSTKSDGSIEFGKWNLSKTIKVDKMKCS